MDMQGEGARHLLAALAECSDRLRTFAYKLYLRHHGSSWTQNLVVSGTPFTIGRQGSNEVFERCFVPSVRLHLSDSTAIAFSIHLCWNADIWMVEADVEVQDDNEDDPRYLWHSQAKRTQSLDEAIAYLVDATRQVVHYGEARDFEQAMHE